MHCSAGLRHLNLRTQLSLLSELAAIERRPARGRQAQRLPIFTYLASSSSMSPSLATSTQFSSDTILSFQLAKR
jgi:hypothetical protein